MQSSFHLSIFPSYRPICHLQFAICNLQSAICNLQSVICNLPSVICNYLRMVGVMQVLGAEFLVVEHVARGGAAS